MSQTPIMAPCKRIGPAHGVSGRDEREVVLIVWAGFGQGASPTTSNEGRRSYRLKRVA
jgi:hypothetical protein